MPVISKNGLEEALRGVPPDQLAIRAFQELELAEKVYKKIRHLEQEKRNLLTQYEAGIKAINEELKNAQKDCKHWDQSFFPDASGNNDSEYQCDICHRTSRRRMV
jgi:hypothetical protein